MGGREKWRLGERCYIEWVMLDPGAPSVALSTLHSQNAKTRYVHFASRNNHWPGETNMPCFWAS